MSAESGNCKNETVTTYQVKDKEGKIMTETVKQSKDDGKVDRELDGQKVETPDAQSTSKGQISYIQGNSEYIIVKLLESIQYEIKHLKEIATEIAYYCSHLEPKKKDN